jgi:exodeoxyribonuclease VII large subunit
MKIYQVSEVISGVKTILEDNFVNLTIEGEISNFSYSSSGHYYFSLSDKNSLINCACFKFSALKNPILKQIKDGQKVLVTGSLSVYPVRGSFQLIIEKILPQGKGDLSYQFEVLKNKLKALGLFDQDKKLAIPLYPKKIAIVTALGGAALQDFLKIISRRSFRYHIVISPALVQGEKAPLSIVNALKKVYEVEGIDLIVLARGGGSLEDLWAFNDEGLIHFLAKRKIPIVSAIGHQVDFTLCDFVCDLRAETPSAAAEIMSSPYAQLNTKLDNISIRLSNQIGIISKLLSRRLEKVQPTRFVQIIQKKIFSFEKRLMNLDLSKNSFERLSFYELAQRLDDVEKSLPILINKNFTNMNHRYKMIENSLNLLNPNGVLDRGYVFLKNTRGKVVSNLSDFQKIEKSSSIEITFKDGSGVVFKND